MRLANQTAVIDLDARFGDRYRLSWEADGATRASWPAEDRAWLRQIRCRYGVISPHGGLLLQAMTDRPRIGARLRALPCVVAARGHEETVVQFHVDDIDAVFGVLHPYRRRRLSEEQRTRQAEVLQRARQKRRESLSEDEFTGQESTQRPIPSPTPEPGANGP